MVLTFGLVSIALYDVIYTLRTSGDPTTSIADSASATTINNPGYRESDRTGEKSLINCLLKLDPFY